jgi:hypothetical protein
MKKEEKSLKEQLNPSQSKRALNIAELTREKLKVVEARFDAQDKEFRERVDGYAKPLRTEREALTAEVIKLREDLSRLKEHNERVMRTIRTSVILSWLFRINNWKEN